VALWREAQSVAVLAFIRYESEPGPGGKGTASPWQTIRKPPSLCRAPPPRSPPPGAVDTVRLIVSELATNAVQHTFGQSPTFTVDLRLERDEELRIGVTDSHPRWPQRLPAAVRQDNGRGMVIIRSLTAECGGQLLVTPTPEGGKTVWIVLPWTVPVQS
jgi:sensor histidine kinase regulating citrate/malate metabolism